MSMEPWRVGLEQGDGGCDGQVQGDPGLGNLTAKTGGNIVMPHTYLTRPKQTNPKQPQPT